jgi:ATP-dependent RNA helicase DDX43
LFSGKTLAFLLPGLINVIRQINTDKIAEQSGPYILILAPTRELAIQIEKEVVKYQYKGIKAICIHGGNNLKQQIDLLESGVEIVVATPGRLNDLVAGGYIKLESITYLVIDEADKMLEMVKKNLI